MPAEGAQVDQLSFDDFAGKWVRFQPTLAPLLD